MGVKMVSEGGDERGYANFSSYGIRDDKLGISTLG